MRIFEFVFEAVSIFFLIMTPPMLVWGWIRWARRTKQWSIPAISSLSAFALATASASPAVASALYAHAVGGFQYYDPRLMRIYAWGALLSASALILSITGIWRLSPLRWHALFCSFGTLVYWFAMAEAE